MKNKLLNTLIAGVFALSAGCIVDSFIIVVPIPAEYCFDVGTSDDEIWEGHQSFSIFDLINDVNSDYPDEVAATSVSDIIAKVTGGFPAGGQVSGTVSFMLDGGAEITAGTFSGNYSDFAGDGVSLLNPNDNLIQFNQNGINALLAALTSTTGLPSVDLVEVWASGTTTPVTADDVKIKFIIVLNVDVNIEP